MAQSLDYANNIYLAVHLNPSSSAIAYNSPIVLPRYESVTDEGMVGNLQDVKLLKVPKETWDDAEKDILASLKSQDGVMDVQVQQPKTRAKRDEF